MIRATNTAIWDVCYAGVVVGTGESSCGEYGEDGNGSHFGGDGTLFGEKSEVVEFKTRVERPFEGQKQSFIACSVPRRLKSDICSHERM
jgi:hypothetical protein